MSSCCLYLDKCLCFLFFFFLPWRLQLTHVAVSRVTTFPFEIYHVWHWILSVSMATKPPKSQLNIRFCIKPKGEWRCYYGNVQFLVDSHSVHALKKCSVTDKNWFLLHCLLGDLKPGKMLPTCTSSTYLYWSMSIGEAGLMSHLSSLSNGFSV